MHCLCKIENMRKVLQVRHYAFTTQPHVTIHSFQSFLHLDLNIVCKHFATLKNFTKKKIYIKDNYGQL